jgi:hypothetical protein
MLKSHPRQWPTDASIGSGGSGVIVGHKGQTDDGDGEKIASPPACSLPPKGEGLQGAGCAAEEVYFIGENAAGISILFCWLTKNSRVLGGQLGNFWDSARTFARAARSG